MKMSKKIISLLLVLVLSMSMSVTALAQTSSRDDFIESLGLQNVSPSAIGFATDFNSLRSLLESKVDNIVVLNDIQMQDTLTIDYNVLFATPLTKVSLLAAQDKRHFNVTGEDVTIEVERSNGGKVILDGDYIGGGIYSDSDADFSLTIINLSILRCNGSGIEMESSYGYIRLAGTTDISDNSGYGVSAWETSIDITDSTTICNNELGGVSTSYELISMSGGEVSYNNGPGLSNYYGFVYISGGLIAWNQADVGGGVNVQGHFGSGFSMSGGEISNNIARYSGGGIYSNVASIYGGTIESNYAVYTGGGISCYYSVSLENCNVIGNIAGNVGGGIFIENPGYVDVGNNVVFSRNYPDNIYPPV